MERAFCHSILDSVSEYSGDRVCVSSLMFGAISKNKRGAGEIGPALDVNYVMFDY